MMALSAEFGGASAAAAAAAAAAAHVAGFGAGADGQLHGSGGAGLRASRVFVCTRDDPLRTVVERLSVPGVRRLIVVQPETRRVEGLISLSDVVSFLFVNQPVQLSQVGPPPVPGAC
jgi:CBS domain-containing protein